MLTLVDQPDVLSLAKNDIIFKISTDNYVATDGVKSSIDIRYFPTDGDTLTFSWGDESITFLTATSLDNSGTKTYKFMGSYSSFNDENQYLENQLMPCLIANETLFENFDISIHIQSTTLHWIRITAKNEGVDYTLSLSSGSSHFSTANIVSGVDKVVNTNFKIVFDVLVRDGDISSTSYKTLGQFEQIPDDNSEVEFNIYRVIYRYMNSLGGDVPTFNQNIKTECSKNIVKFYIRYREVYGDILYDYYVNSSAYYYALFGGLRKQDFNGNTLIGQLSSSTVKPFLTWQPASKEVGRNDQEYLYYYYDGTSGIKTQVKLFFDDGTTSVNYITSIYTSHNNCVQILPAGFSQLNLSTYEVGGITIIKYQLKLVDASNVAISDMREYLLDENEYDNARYFLYKNSIGGYDTIRFLGDAENTLDMDFDLNERFLASGFTSQDGQRVKSSISFTQAMEVSTGLIDKELKISLQDLLISPDVYEIVDGKFVSIQILNKDNEKIFNEGEDVHPLILKYQYNFTNLGFSNL
jgi:hypothetical protein